MKTHFIFRGITEMSQIFHKIIFLQSVVNTRFTTFDINNGDGIDLGDASNVQILSNFYDTGDDAIAMGTGQGKRSNSLPVEFVVIRNNYFRHSHGCSFGGNLGDWVQDVLIEVKNSRVTSS